MLITYIQAEGICTQRVCAMGIKKSMPHSIC